MKSRTPLPVSVTDCLWGSVLMAVMALTAPMAQAAVPNGDFEGGVLLPGWSKVGKTLGETAAIGVTPTQGIYQGYINNTGNFAATVPAVVGLLAVPGASILALGQGSPTTGSAMAQDLTVSAGDVLSFDWNFLTDEHDEDPQFNDFAIFTIGSTPYFLASRHSTFSTLNIVSPPPGFDGQTNWTTQSHTFTSSGTVRLGYAVFNVGDAGHDSVLLLDAITVTSVPEPGAGWLFAIGALALFGRCRPKRAGAPNTGQPPARACRCASTSGCCTSVWA